MRQTNVITLMLFYSSLRRTYMQRSSPQNHLSLDEVDLLSHEKVKLSLIWIILCSFAFNVYWMLK